jgi:multimeric flavodoxin WrbA
MKIGFADGEVWTFRVAGPFKNFIDRVLRVASGDEVVTLTSPRGAEFAQELELGLVP